jgi:bifunctional DNA-binding transcriptional regulator/antitoxin component of YhaV-PrlF toxin-antitoxin module
MAGNIAFEHKKISISSKRQITIPIKFFNAVGFKNEAECILKNNQIIIRPLKDNIGGEFAEQILTDLIDQGHSGDELLKQFKTAQNKIRSAVEKMLEQAARAASGQGEYSIYSDVFDPE